jgi:hypothetical protein
VAVDSLNVPVPGRVRRLAADLAPRLAGLDRVREDHTLVCKRFERRVDRAAVRAALAGTPAFEARIAGLDAFEHPVRGPGPVVYLAVESPGLCRLHDRLVGRFGAVESLEGPSYTPHVTLGRGGDPDAVARLLDASVEPVGWTVSRLDCWDAERRVAVGSVGLPA